MKFAVIGGDMRLARLAELLHADGHTVSTFALDKILLDDGITQEISAGAAAEGAECAVFPLPVTLSSGFLNSPLSTEVHSIRGILPQLARGTLICGGRIEEDMEEECRRLGLKTADYYQREELVVANAEATAEGALQTIMEETPVTVCGSRCLIVGYGRIGRLLAGMLRALGADVTVAARKYSDEAWIRTGGYQYLYTYGLSGRLSRFDVIVNTVPARIFTKKDLEEMRRCYLYLDVASKPGGADFALTSRMGVKAIWSHGIPGEVAPDSSGRIIRDTIYHIIKEQVNHVCLKE